MPPKLPEITSLAPASGATYVFSQTVTLEGSAYDVDDGVLPDGKLEWSSDLMGPLGVGHMLQTTDLVTGTHVITLKATDSSSNVVTATTTVIITDEPSYSQVYLPLVVR